MGTQSSDRLRRCNHPSQWRCRWHVALFLQFGVLLRGQPACEFNDGSTEVDAAECSRSDFGDLLFDDADLQSLSLLQMKAAKVQRDAQQKLTSPEFVQVKPPAPSADAMPTETDSRKHAESLVEGKRKMADSSKHAESLVEEKGKIAGAKPRHYFSFARRKHKQHGTTRDGSCGILCRLQVLAADIQFGRASRDLGLLFFGCAVIIISLTLWCCRRTPEPVLKVQLRVDHFVSHSFLHPQRINAGANSSSLVEKSCNAAESLLTKSTIACPAPTRKDFPESGDTDSAASTPQSRAPVAGSSAGSAGCALTQMEPVLTLPLCETWYAVSIEPMVTSDGSFDILRIAGYPVLHGTVRRTRQARVLEISCSGLPTKDGQILAAITVPLAGGQEDEVTGGTQGTMLNVSCGGQHVGILRPAKGGQHMLTCGGDDVMSIEVTQEQLMMRTADTGKALAQASWFDDTEIFAGAGHLAMCVNSGVDTVLVICCALAMVVFSNDADLPKMPCSGPPVDQANPAG